MDHPIVHAIPPKALEILDELREPNTRNKKKLIGNLKHEMKDLAPTPVFTTRARILCHLSDPQTLKELNRDERAALVRLMLRHAAPGWCESGKKGSRPNIPEILKGLSPQEQCNLIAKDYRLEMTANLLTDLCGRADNDLPSGDQSFLSALIAQNVRAMTMQGASHTELASLVAIIDQAGVLPSGPGERPGPLSMRVQILRDARDEIAKGLRAATPGTGNSGRHRFLQMPVAPRSEAAQAQAQAPQLTPGAAGPGSSQLDHEASRQQAMANINGVHPGFKIPLEERLMVPLEERLMVPLEEQLMGEAGEMDDWNHNRLLKWVVDHAISAHTGAQHSPDQPSASPVQDTQQSAGGAGASQPPAHSQVGAGLQPGTAPNRMLSPEKATVSGPQEQEKKREAEGWREDIQPALNFMRKNQG